MVTRIQIRRLASLFIPSTERSSALVDELIGRALAMDNFEQLNQIHPDSKFAPIITPESVSDPLNKPDISRLQTGDETSSRPINRFRKPIYEKGELDNSDPNKRPSRSNPHSFDPASLPPTHSRSIANFVNHLPLLQRLVDLGMDLFEVDKSAKIGRHIMRLDLERDVKPKIHWIVNVIGLSIDELGNYLTRNPYFLVQELADLDLRINYLTWKKFTEAQIRKIVIENRYWLNMDVKLVDARLGWIQRQFQLPVEEVRILITKEPRIIAFGLGPIQRIVIILNRDCGFSPHEVKHIMQKDPRVFMSIPTHILRMWRYLTITMKVNNQQIADVPFVLRCHISALRARFEFLVKLRKANFDTNLPGHVSLSDLIHPSDRYFAQRVAGSFLTDYNKFLKYL